MTVLKPWLHVQFIACIIACNKLHM